MQWNFIHENQVSSFFRMFEPNLKLLKEKCAIQTERLSVVWTSSITTKSSMLTFTSENNVEQDIWMYILLHIYNYPFPLFSPSSTVLTVHSKQSKWMHAHSTASTFLPLILIILIQWKNSQPAHKHTFITVQGRTIPDYLPCLILPVYTVMYAIGIN